MPSDVRGAPKEPTALLRVGVDDSPAPPLCFGMPGTPDFRGFEVDLVASIAGRLGSRTVCDADVWETAVHRLLGGDLDMLCRGVTMTPERQRVVSFSDPYLETALVLVVRRNSPIHAVEDLIGLNVGVRRATTAETLVRKGCPAATVCTFDSHGECFQALDSGAVAAVVDHETIARHFMRFAEGLRETATLEGTPLKYGMVFAPTNERLREQVNRVLAELRSDGTWEQHRGRWLTEGRERT